MPPEKYDDIDDAPSADQPAEMRPCDACQRWTAQREREDGTFECLNDSHNGGASA